MKLKLRIWRQTGAQAKGQLVPYEGDDSWVEGTLMDIKKCLDKKPIKEEEEVL